MASYWHVDALLEEPRVQRPPALWKFHRLFHLVQLPQREAASSVKEHGYNVSAAAGERSIAVQNQAGTGAFMYTLDEDGTCAILFPST